jgi:hypothetical protein
MQANGLWMSDRSPRTKFMLEKLLYSRKIPKKMNIISK